MHLIILASYANPRDIIVCLLVGATPCHNYWGRTTIQYEDSSRLSAHSVTLCGAIPPRPHDTHGNRVYKFSVISNQCHVRSM